MINQKRILILYADAGIGHRTAAFAIADALMEQVGDTCQVDVVNPLDDKRAPVMLRDSQADHDWMVRDVPELYKLGYQASDAGVTSTLMESGLIVLLFEVMRDIVRRYQPDAIITTYPLYQAPLDAVFTVGRFVIPLITVVTDLATVHRLWFNNAVSQCLVPTPQVRDLALDAGLPPRKVHITGIPVPLDVVKDTRPAEVIRAELGWRPDLTTLLAVGGKRVTGLYQALHVVNHSGMPIQLAVVAGGDDVLYDQLQRTYWHTPVQVYNFVHNMPALMHASDLMMCKAGGLIVTESLACGLPMLLVDVNPGAEAGNADYVVETGTGEFGQDPIAVLEILCHWLEHGGQLLEQRAATARTLGRPQAAYTVADYAWTAAQHGPHLKSGRRFLTRSRLLDLLRRNEVPVKEDSFTVGYDREEHE